MANVLWVIFGWILKIVIALSMISFIAFIFRFIWLLATNGGRKWYYYDPSKPWKGGYWTPLLPSTPPYNEYEWNPNTCRFEHKETGKPLFEWEKPVTRHGVTMPYVKKEKKKRQRPEWLRFLLEETPETLMEKHRRKKWSKARERDTKR